MNIIFRLKEQRMKKGYSLQSLSMKSKISKSEINKIENNLLDPRLSSVCKIAHALGVTLFALFEIDYD